VTLRKAVKRESKLRLGLWGVSGSGKTFMALLIAEELAKREKGRVALYDTEGGSAQKLANRFDFDFDELTDTTPEGYSAKLQEAYDHGYPVVVLDSLTHGWITTLGLVDQYTQQSSSGSSYTSGWKEMTPRHRAFLQAIVRSPIHVICTVRAKDQFVLDEKNRPQKVGLGYDHRSDVIYEFDLFAQMHERQMIVTKSRIDDLAEGTVIEHPGVEQVDTIMAWLDGAQLEEAPKERVAELVKLLKAEGKSDEEIEAGMRKIRFRNLGVLAPEAVEKNIEAATERTKGTS
jgi:hypothetical protein